MSNKTNWGYIVKENLLNEVTIPREFDATELAVSKMRVETGTDNPILMAKDAAETYIDNTVKAQITASGIVPHKTIFGEAVVNSEGEIASEIATYNSGGDITLKDGTAFNKAAATPGDIIVFEPALVGAFRFEEGLILTDQSMIQQTNNNAQEDEITAIRTQQALHNGQIVTLTTKETNALQTDGSRQMDGGYVAANSHDVIIKQELDSAVAGNKTLIDANTTRSTANVTSINTLQPIVAGNQVAVEDYLDNKADFARMEDLGNIDVIISGDDSIPVQSGQTYTWTHTVDLSQLVDGLRTVVKLVNGTTSLFIQDSFNDGSRTAQSIFDDDDIHVTITDTTVVLEDVRVDLTGYQLKEFEQTKGASASGIDTVARASAQSAQNTANTAQALANSNKTKVDAINLNSKQDVTDNSLQTATKSVIGAINEVKAVEDAHTEVLTGIQYNKVEGRTSIDGGQYLIDDTSLIALEAKLGI